MNPDHRDFSEEEARTEVRRAQTRREMDPPTEVTEVEEIDAELDDRPTDRPASSAPEERWQQIMAEFVDDPRGSVKAAHELVGQSVQQLVDRLNDKRASLEQQWSRGDDVNTEKLRVCLQQYRAFFNRLLSGDSLE
jgi:hypothetical protein